MSAMSAWPMIGSASLVLVLLTMSVAALAGHVRDLVVHRERRALAMLAVFVGEVVVIATGLVLSDLAWWSVLVAAGACAAIERAILYGQDSRTVRTSLRSSACGASRR